MYGYTKTHTRAHAKEALCNDVRNNSNCECALFFCTWWSSHKLVIHKMFSSMSKIQHGRWHFTSTSWPSSSPLPSPSPSLSTTTIYLVCVCVESGWGVWTMRTILFIKIWIGFDKRHTKCASTAFYIEKLLTTHSPTAICKMRDKHFYQMLSCSAAVLFRMCVRVMDALVHLSELFFLFHSSWTL